MNMRYTLEQLQQRHSVRKYADRQVPADILAILEREVAEINAAYSGIRFSLVIDNGEAFGSFKKTYGQFKGVKNYLVGVVDTLVADSEEIAGFAGEQFCMLAVVNGLGTCFVGATYDPAKVQVNLSATEKISFLIPFGYEDENGPGFVGKLVQRVAHANSLKPEQFYDPGLAFFNLQEAMGRMSDLFTGLQALECAPSGMNKQPARVWIGEDTFLHMGLSFKGDYTSNDLGIAKFNFQAVVPGKWEWGVGVAFQPGE